MTDKVRRRSGLSSSFSGDADLLEKEFDDDDREIDVTCGRNEICVDADTFGPDVVISDEAAKSGLISVFGRE